MPKFKIILLVIIYTINLLSIPLEETFEENGIIYVKEKTKQQIRTEKANKLLKITKLAKKNNIEAQWKLVNMYSNGSELTPPIFKRKLKWLKELSKNKDVIAQFQLAELYFMGHSWQLKHNFIKSLHWYKKAADQNNSIAMIKIANFYYYGIGVKKNLHEAKKWYMKAKHEGDNNADFFLNKFKT